MVRGNATATEPVDLYVGQQLRARRKRLKMSQADLGREVGLSFQQIQKYEVGVNRLAASTLARCATALSCQPGDFFPTNLSGALAGFGEPEPLSALGGFPGGARLEQLYQEMTPRQRKALVQVAEALTAGAGE